MLSLKWYLKRTEYLPIIITILIMISSIGGLPPWCASCIFVGYIIGLLYYGSFRNEIEIVPLFFWAYLPINIILTQPDAVFRSWERLLSFSLMFLVASPIIQSKEVRKVRHKLLGMVILFSIVISGISFFCFFVGVNLFEGGYIEEFNADYNENLGYFSGITKQSMILGPLAGISTIYLLDRILKKRNAIMYPLVVLTVGAMLFAASRGALIALIGSVFFSIAIKYRLGKRLLKTSVMIFFLYMLIYPFASTYINSVINKHGDIEEGSFGTRTEKVEARWAEFKKSPVCGIGFAAVDVNGKDEYDTVSGAIEPGSSWLAVLSMTGIIGFLLFSSIYFLSYISVRDSESILLFCMLIFFSIHMLIEGYIYASGSPLCYIMWLVLGNCYDYKCYKYDCNPLE